MVKENLNISSSETISKKESESEHHFNKEFKENEVAQKESKSDLDLFLNSNSIQFLEDEK